MEIIQKCARCKGTGQIDPYGEPPGETECPDCEGNGFREWGTLPDVMNKLNDIKQKCDEIMLKSNEIMAKLNE